MEMPPDCYTVDEFSGLSVLIAKMSRIFHQMDLPKLLRTLDEIDKPGIREQVIMNNEEAEHGLRTLRLSVELLMPYWDMLKAEKAAWAAAREQPTKDQL